MLKQHFDYPVLLEQGGPCGFSVGKPAMGGKPQKTQIGAPKGKTAVHPT